MKFFFDDGDQHVGGHGAPDLRLHRVLAGGQKSLDTQVLLDSLEEQLDLPTTFVQSSDGQRGQRHVVGQKHQRLARLWVVEFHPTQMLGLVFSDMEPIQGDALIANHAGGSISCARVHPASIHATLGAGNEESTALVEFEQPRKIQIAPVHDVEGTGLEWQGIEHIDIAQLAVADMDESGNGPSQIQQGVHFHGGLGGAKRCPIEQTQTQVDGGGVQRIDSGIQIDAHGLFDVEISGTRNQARGQCVIGAPVPQVQRHRPVSSVRARSSSPCETTCPDWKTDKLRCRATIRARSTAQTQ